MMSASSFEMLRRENADINERILEQELFADVLSQYADRVDLEQRLNAIHSEIDVHTLKEELMIHPSFVVQLWRNHHSKISVAASIAIFAILSTLFISGYFTSRNQASYQPLKLEVDQVKKSNDKLKSKINELDTKIKVQGSSKNNVLIPVKFKGFIGSGFALSSNGYIVTNYHVINGGRFCLCAKRRRRILPHQSCLYRTAV